MDGISRRMSLKLGVFSTIAIPLTSLSKKDYKFTWDLDCEKDLSDIEILFDINTSPHLSTRCR